MKILIAVLACWQYRYPKAIGHPLHRRTDHRMRDLMSTWWPTIKDAPEVDGKFFYGHVPASGKMEYAGAQDSILLDARDDYEGLKEKFHAMCAWAWKREYSHVLKIDNDTAVDVPALIDFTLNDYFDYVGQVCGDYCYGGAGYLMSRDAVGIIASATVPPDAHGIPALPEDHWAGIVLRKAGCLPEHSGRFNSERGITLHCREMSQMQRWWKERCRPDANFAG